MSEPTLIRDDRGALLIATAAIRTRRAARYADTLARRLSDRADVEPLPGGYRVRFDVGEGLLHCGPEVLSLLLTADDGPSLANVRDAFRIELERLGRQDGLRVVWR